MIGLLRRMNAIYFKTKVEELIEVVAAENVSKTAIDSIVVRKLFRSQSPTSSGNRNVQVLVVVAVAAIVSVVVVEW